MCGALSAALALLFAVSSFAGDDRIFTGVAPVGAPRIETLDAIDADEFSELESVEAPVDVTTASPQPKKRGIVGLQADAGFPEGLGISAILRPWYWLILQFGLATNGASFGLRGGVTVVPFDYWISPSATVEAGHAFEGDLNWIARIAADDPKLDYAVLKRVSYDYVNGLLGLEIGIPGRFTFFARVGVSYVRSELKGFEKDLQAMTGDPGFTSKNPVVTYLGPAGKVGLIFYFW